MNIGPFGGVSGAPLSGQVNIGPFGGVTSGPGDGGSMQLPFPTDQSYRPNNTQGWFWSQETVPHHYIAIDDSRDPSSAAFTRNLGTGMLVLARSKNIPENADPPKYSVTNGNNTAQLMEVTQLNQWLESRSSLYTHADEILKEWKLLGVIKVEVAPNTQANYGKRPSGRMLNLIVGHRVSLVNLFGKDIIDGMKLFIVVKKCKVRSQKRHRDANGDIQNMRWRLLPYARKNCQKPPLSMLKYEDEDGTTKYGSYYYVGEAGGSLGGTSMPCTGASAGSAAEELSEHNMRLFQSHMTGGTIETYLGI